MNRESIQISDTVVVENGPAKKRAIATEELLDDAVTAEHYKVGKRDAHYKPIVLGQEMAYLDYRGEWAWYIYQRAEVGIDAEGRVVGIDQDGRLVDSPAAIRTEPRFVVADIQATKDDALIAAATLAAKE
jgi:hypothetical protein